RVGQHGDDTIRRRLMPAPDGSRSGQACAAGVDVVVHCTTRRQAEYVPSRIAARMSEVGLRLHPDKTRIVYCKDGRRRAEHEHTSFTFLGYAFQARGARSKTGRIFTGFLPALSPEAHRAKVPTSAGCGSTGALTWRSRTS